MMNFKTFQMKMITCIIVLLCFLSSNTHGFGGGSLSTLSVTSGASPIVCGITAYEAHHHVQCWKDGHVYDLFANVSFQGVAGGFDTSCGLTYGGNSIICWNSVFSPKMIYQDKLRVSPIKQLSVGNTQMCSVTINNSLWCWMDKRFQIRVSDFKYVSSGNEYTCGVRIRDDSVSCFGKNKEAAIQMENKLSIFKFTSLFVGGHHVCGFDLDGVVICVGNNDWGQANVPDKTPHAFTSLALGINHTCGILSVNKSVTCWGGDGGYVKNRSINISVLSFETIVAGSDFTCGLLSTGGSVICWGIGWVYPTSPSFKDPLFGPCVSCDCGIDIQSQKICNSRGSICNRSNTKHNTPDVKRNRRILVESWELDLKRNRRVVVVVSCVLYALGSVGCLIGASALLHFLLTRCALRNTSTLQVETNNSQGEKLQQRTRSSPPWARCMIEFTLEELNIATNTFSLESKIGSGGYGVVYKGKLVDGCEVAIKRIKKGDYAQVLQENDLRLLSRLEHPNLVPFVGYCQDVEDNYFVYNYMKNGSLFDNLGKDNSVLNNWKTRSRIAVGAANGIRRFQNSKFPPIAHGHINSSNILLDENFEAYISDYDFSQTGLLCNQSTSAAGYTDPHNLDAIATTMSDVYAFGVVLLELMFGKRAMLPDSEVNGGAPVFLVDYAVPIVQHEPEWKEFLDKKVEGPFKDDFDGLQIFADTAVLCVISAPNDRPSMNDVINRLTKAYYAIRKT